jgi:hypothetical protein
VRVLARVGISGHGLGTLVLVNADVEKVKGVHGRDQQSEGKLRDMLR